MKKQTGFKTTGHLNISFVVAIITVLALAGCSSIHKSAGKTLTTEDFTLTYTDKAQAGTKIDALTLQHPLPITERQMLFHMVALTYESLSLLGEAGPVFTKDDINKTKRLLTKALNKAHSQNIIGFEVESENGTTKGELFASNGKLHWRFFEIQGVKYSLTHNPLAQRGAAWRLVPKKGQKYHATNELLGTKQWTSWIEAKIDLPAPANLKIAPPRKNSPNSGTVQSASPPAQPNSLKATVPGKTPADLEEKLKFLKYLHENQLIDKREYEQKRKDLLDQYL
jgi:hypothetical protein